MHYYPIHKTFSGSLITLIGPPGSLWGGFGPSGPWHSLPWQSPGVALSIVTSLVNKVMKMMYLQWQPLDWSSLTVNVDSPISLEILTFKSIMIILGTIGFGNLNEFSENSGLWLNPIAPITMMIMMISKTMSMTDDFDNCQSDCDCDDDVDRRSPSALC